MCRRGRIWPPLPYPVFVLADLLHLEPLGTLALGHLPGDLPAAKTGKVPGFCTFPPKKLG